MFLHLCSPQPKPGPHNYYIARWGNGLLIGWLAQGHNSRAQVPPTLGLGAHDLSHCTNLPPPYTHNWDLTHHSFVYHLQSFYLLFLYLKERKKGTYIKSMWLITVYSLSQPFHVKIWGIFSRGKAERESTQYIYMHVYMKKRGEHWTVHCSCMGMSSKTSSS